MKKQAHSADLAIIISYLPAANGRIVSFMINTPKKKLKIETLQNIMSMLTGGEMRDTKTLNLSRNIVSLQVFVRVIPVFHLA